MSGWQGILRQRAQTEFEVMLQSTAQRRKKKLKQNQPKLDLPEFVSNLIGDAGAPLANYNFQCGCFGTMHEVVNNCERCGRVVCALEGERPCPFCGSIVLSQETIEKGDAEVESRTREIQRLISESSWVPEAQRSAQLPQPQNISLDGDWFDQELLHIFDA